jgi:hypothetical protein
MPPKRFQSAPVLLKIVRSKLVPAALAVLAATSSSFAQEVIPQPLQVVISVAEQKLVVLRDGGVVVKYPVSTSKFGLGDAFGSYKTPLGHLQICDKVGADLASGTVIKSRTATNEVLPVNAPGRDPIVTRILWLSGEDEQNRNAKARGIYIHGTTEEKRIGEPVSYGCIRMRSRDVIELFDHLPIGTPVNIIASKLPKLPKYVPAPPVVLVNNVPVSTKTHENARLAANTKPSKTERPPEIASGPATHSGDQGATQAMKGSILSAGLPDAPSTKIGPQKQDKMQFQSWSAVSLRESDTKR